MSKQKIYLVTGSSSGIGLAVCQSLLNAGHRVIGIARRQAAIPSKHYTHIELDLADLKYLPDKLKQLTKDYPQLDGIVACAGSSRFSSLEEFSYMQIQQILDLNLSSQIFLARAFLTVLKQQKHADLIFIGSEAAIEGGKQGSIYCAAKFGLRGFTQALRQECASSNLRISLINPGMVRTAFFDELNFRPGKDSNQAIEADDVADTVMMICNMRPGTVVDEINLSPHKKVIDFKKF